MKSIISVCLLIFTSASVAMAQNQNLPAIPPQQQKPGQHLMEKTCNAQFMPGWTPVQKINQAIVAAVTMMFKGRFSNNPPDWYVDSVNSKIQINDLEILGAFHENGRMLGYYVETTALLPVAKNHSSYFLVRLLVAPVEQDPFQDPPQQDPWAYQPQPPRTYYNTKVDTTDAAKYGMSNEHRRMWRAEVFNMRLTPNSAQIPGTRNLFKNGVPEGFLPIPRNIDELLAQREVYEWSDTRP